MAPLRIQNCARPVPPSHISPGDCAPCLPTQHNSLGTIRNSQSALCPSSLKPEHSCPFLVSLSISINSVQIHRTGSMLLPTPRLFLRAALPISTCCSGASQVPAPTVKKSQRSCMVAQRGSLTHSAARCYCGCRINAFLQPLSCCFTRTALVLCCILTRKSDQGPANMVCNHRPHRHLLI